MLGAPQTAATVEKVGVKLIEMLTDCVPSLRVDEFMASRHVREVKLTSEAIRVCFATAVYGALRAHAMNYRTQRSSPSPIIRPIRH
jgi:hypothetical protein